jgi:hypothetical protein
MLFPYYESDNRRHRKTEEEWWLEYGEEKSSLNGKEGRPKLLTFTATSTFSGKGGRQTYKHCKIISRPVFLRSQIST